MEPRRLGGASPNYYDHDAVDDRSAHVAASKRLDLALDRSRSASPASELIRPTSTALPAVSELAYHHHHFHHHHQQYVDSPPALQPLANPEHHQLRHRYQELSPQHYEHRPQLHYGPAYPHYEHRHEPPYRHELEPEQPLSPHIHSQLKLQPRVLPSVYHSPVTHSPDGSGLSTPRLPPISMLTAAASMQPRAPEPLERQMPVGLASQHTQSGPLTARDRARAPPAARVHRHDDEEENLCRYRNKRCSYPRAIKRNGDRHNLCEKHRAKANQNQRKLESKRRIQKRAPDERKRDERAGASLDVHYHDVLAQTHSSASVLLSDRALVGGSLPLPPRQASYTQHYQGLHSSCAPDGFASF